MLRLAASGCLITLLAHGASAQSWTASTLTVGDGPRGIAVVDVLSNGIPDLAVANASAGSVTVLQNNGLGAFTTAATIALTAPNPIAVAAGRFDATGQRNDLVVACNDPVSPGVYQLAKIVQAGDVGQTVTYLTAPSARPAHVACGDLNGDGLDEIVVACEGDPFSSSGVVEVFWTGTPPAPIVTFVGTAVRVLIANLDPQGGADTDLDLAIIFKANPDRVQFVANDGAGNLTSAGSVPLPSTGFATSMCGGDLDGDGDFDLAVLQPDPLGPSNGFRVLANDGALALTAGNVTGGKFASVGPFSVTGSYATDIACGDFESDTVRGPGGVPFAGESRQDVCVINGGLGAPVVRGGFNGTGFATTASPTTGTNPIASALADFNADGCADVAIVNQGDDSVTLNLTVPPAIAEPFGTGCSGSSGVPAAAAVGLPTSGTTSFTATLSSARASALCFLMFSVPGLPGYAEDLPLPPGPCRLYTPSPISTFFFFTNGAGGAAVTFGVPLAVPLGVDAYLQWAVFDPAGAYGPGALAISNGLRLQVGT